MALLHFKECRDFSFHILAKFLLGYLLFAFQNVFCYFYWQLVSLPTLNLIELFIHCV